jgi:hypothetical protein
VLILQWHDLQIRIADPDPTFYFSADPDPAPHKNDGRICDQWPTDPPRLHFAPPLLHWEDPRPFIHFEPLIDFDFNTEPDPAFSLYYGSGSIFKKTMRIHDDPDPQPCVRSTYTARKKFPFSLLHRFDVFSVLIVSWLPGEPVELLPVEIELAKLGHRLEPQPLVLNM